MEVEIKDWHIKVQETTTLTHQQRQAWDRLDSPSMYGAFYSSPAWADVVTRSDGAPQRLIQVYEGQRLVGALTADLMPHRVPDQYHVQRLIQGECQHITEGLANWQSPADLMPTMVATTRAGRICDLRVDGASSPQRQEAIMAMVVRGLEEETKRLNACSTSFLYIPANARTLRTVLRQAGYHETVIGTFPYLPTNFLCLEDYPALFPPHRRREIRREMRAFEKDAQITLRRRPLLESLDDFLEMIAYNYEKYQFSFQREAYRLRMQALGESLQDRALVLELLWNGKVAGACLFNHYKDLLYAHVVGIHPDIPRKVFPYFNLAYYQGIQLALELGCSHLMTGASEALETKLSRGCTLEPTYLSLKTADPTMIERLRQMDLFMSAKFQKLQGRSSMQVKERETAQSLDVSPTV